MIPGLNRILWSLKTRLYFYTGSSHAWNLCAKFLSFSLFRWGGLCLKSLNHLHQQAPAEPAAVSSHVHHPAEHSVQALPSSLFQSSNADTCPCQDCPPQQWNISKYPCIRHQWCDMLTGEACKHQEKSSPPFWVDLKFLQGGLDIFNLFRIRNWPTCGKGFNRRSCIRDSERPKGPFMLHQKLYVEKGNSLQSRSQPMETVSMTASSRDRRSTLGALLSLGLVSQNPARSLQSSKMDITPGCYLLALLQLREQRVCSSSELEFKPIRDTFSPCGYQCSVPPSPLSW